MKSLNSARFRPAHAFRPFSTARKRESPRRRFANSPRELRRCTGSRRAGGLPQRKRIRLVVAGTPPRSRLCGCNRCRGKRLATQIVAVANLPREDNSPNKAGSARHMLKSRTVRRGLVAIRVFRPEPALGLKNALTQSLRCGSREQRSCQNRKELAGERIVARVNVCTRSVNVPRMMC
jgi:hypothetical protein